MSRPDDPPVDAFRIFEVGTGSRSRVLFGPMVYHGNDDRLAWRRGSTTARCLPGHSPFRVEHPGVPAPELDCACGLVATTDRDLAVHFVESSRWMPRAHRHVLGRVRVSGWGASAGVVDPTGFGRYEHGEIAELWGPDDVGLIAVGEHYEVPVTVGPAAGLGWLRKLAPGIGARCREECATSPTEARHCRCPCLGTCHGVVRHFVYGQTRHGVVEPRHVRIGRDGSIACGFK